LAANVPSLQPGGSKCRLLRGYILFLHRTITVCKLGRFHVVNQLRPSHATLDFIYSIWPSLSQTEREYHRLLLSSVISTNENYMVGQKTWYLSYITLHCTRGITFWPTLYGNMTSMCVHECHI